MIDYKKYLTRNFWNKLATDFVIKVTDDARAGLMQDGKSNIPYKSEQYKRYKANAMRRLTKGGTLKDFDPSQDYRGKRYYGKKKKLKPGKKGTTSGQRIKGYEGRQIVNTDVSKVNMELTGETFRNYMNGIKVSYAPQDAEKVLGNQALGRQIVGANKKNQEWVFDQIEQQLMKPVTDEWKKDINITIG
jgi:hypothetical protein